MALDGVGELVEEVNERGGGLVGEVERQTHERQVVRFEHDVSGGSYPLAAF